MRRSLLRALPFLLMGSLLVPLLVQADGSSSSSSSFYWSFSSSSSSSSSSAARICVQAAVDVREQAILTGLNTFTASLQPAFAQRKIALYAAWNITDAKQQKAAIKSAWATFKQSKRTAQDMFRIARQIAWSNFHTSYLVCGGKINDESYKRSEDL